MKIAICGTHGIGKTTLAKELSSILKLPLLEEEARKLLNNKFPFFKTEENFEVFKNFQTEVLKSQIQAENNNLKTGFIADRGVIDSLAYVHIRTLIEKDSGKFLKNYKISLDSYINRYDKLIFIRFDPHFISSEKENRNLNPVFMEEIDRFIDYTLLSNQNLNKKVCRIFSLNYEDRLEKSLWFLKRS